MERFAKLSDAIKGMSLQAIDIQRQWNEFHQTELALYEKDSKFIDKVIKTNDLFKLAKPIQPKLLFMKEFEFSMNIKLEISKGKGYEIKLLPLNIGYQARYQSTEETENKISIHVEQVLIHKKNNSKKQKPIS